MTRTRKPRFLALLGILVLLASPALALDETTPEQEILIGLSRTFRKAAKIATPRTVCIRIHLGEKTGFGSGALITPEGHILTCAHVSEPGERMTVILSDGREYPARQLGKNSKNDYALIKIDGGPFPFFALGSSKALKPGDWVLGLGHPGGPYVDRRPAVAVGRITGLHKKLPVQFNVKYYDDAIQIDAPIFAGNSGGPLVNLKGELVGINGAILLVNDNAYATPVDEIARDIPAMKAGKNLTGRAPKDMMKVLQELTSEIDPKDLEKMYGKSPLGRVLGPVLKMFGYRGGGDPKARERKREERRKWGRTFGLEASFLPLGRRLSRSVVTIHRGGKTVGFGVVLSERGEILTNDRILGDAPGGLRVAVGGERRNARVLGRHGPLDVALLKIAPAGLDLEPAVFGNSGALGPGDWLITVGPPSDPVLAVGAVSAMERKIGGNRKIPTIGLMGLFGKPNESPLREYPEVIQHDSKIVKGLFGSPVFNARGYLMGVNVANFYRGSSYATPVLRIAPVLDELRSGLALEPPPFLEAKVPDNPLGGFGEGDMGKILEQFQGGKFFEQFKKFFEGKGGEGDFGKIFEDLLKRFRGSGESETKPPAAVLGIQARDSEAWGADVIQVNPGSGAEKAGMRVGDRIVALGSRDVAELKDLLRLLRRRKPGDRVAVTVVRDGKKVRLVVVLGKRPPRDG